ncbi:MAG: PDZ domain-containing protein, partial [Arenicella sp.]|nr:PDZ domain-containing protein [Arenicella sp.]
LDQDSLAQSRQQRLEQRRADRLASQQPDYRRQQLINAGFAQEEAARIVQIESEESPRQLQAQYDRRREYAASTGSQLSDVNPIRAELGEQNYQRYLEANGLPTSASIGSVIGGSPGESAGLRAGDNVVSYAGERVFNLNDINNLTIQGQVGESVLIEVDRNGESVQLTIPRGPIGINSGRRFRR